MDKELERIRAEVFDTIPSKRPVTPVLTVVAALFFTVGFVAAPTGISKQQAADGDTERTAPTNQVVTNDLPDIELVYNGPV